MNIVKAEARHIPGMLRLLGQVGQVHHEIRPDIFRDGALKYDENALEALLREENKPIFVGEDGGRVLGLVLTTAVEGITRKKIDPKYEGYIHGVGMILLLGLMAAIMFKDIFTIFKG